MINYNGGCEYVVMIEDLAIHRVKELFGAEHAYMMGFDSLLVQNSFH